MRTPSGGLRGSGEGGEQLWPQFLQCPWPFKESGPETKADAGWSVCTPGLSMIGEGEIWSFPSPFGPPGHSDCTATDRSHGGQAGTCFSGCTSDSNSHPLPFLVEGVTETSPSLPAVGPGPAQASTWGGCIHETCLWIGQERLAALLEPSLDNTGPT